MSLGKLAHSELTHSVIGAFYEVYNELGFGFLESIYMEALAWELIQRGHRVRREVEVQIFYRGKRLKRQRVDMIADDLLIVEAKSTFDLHPGARRQLYNYLRATNLEVGLLLHFGKEPRAYREYCPNTEKVRGAASR